MCVSFSNKNKINELITEKVWDIKVYTLFKKSYTFANIDCNLLTFFSYLDRSVGGPHTTKIF